MIMDNNDVDEKTSTLTVKFMVPGLGSGPRAGPICPYSEID